MSNKTTTMSVMRRGKSNNSLERALKSTQYRKEREDTKRSAITTRSALRGKTNIEKEDILCKDDEGQTLSLDTVKKAVSKSSSTKLSKSNPVYYTMSKEQLDGMFKEKPLLQDISELKDKYERITFETENEEGKLDIYVVVEYYSFIKLGIQYNAIKHVAMIFVVIPTPPETHSGTFAAFLSCAPRITNSVGNKIPNVSADMAGSNTHVMRSSLLPGIKMIPSDRMTEPLIVDVVLGFIRNGD